MISIFVALDRSGSMNGSSWINAINTLNEYINGLKAEKVEGKVSITAFDSFDHKTRLVPLAHNQSIAYFENIHHTVISPAGLTPLYDAAAHVMDQALEENPEKAVVVILTDGAENCSTEYTQKSIKTKVELIQSKGWEVLFLGANFDVSEYARDAGMDSTKFCNFNLNDFNSRTTLQTKLSTNTVAYATTGRAIEL